MLLALLLVFAAVALFTLQPWGPTSLLPPPKISPPKGEVGLGDAAVVAPARQRPVVDDARAVDSDSGRSTFVAEPVAAPTHGPGPELGISRGHPVHRSGLASLPARPSKPTPLPAPVVALPEPGPQPPIAPAPTSLLVANFENGLDGWSIAAMGDTVPRVVSGIVRDGEKASVIRLTGDQSRSQLILGGDGGSDEAGAVQIHEGDEYAFAFSFYIQRMVYGEPGADNLILRLKSDASDSLAFGLQLWDPAEDSQDGERGLWSSGEAVGGDRFLAPVSEREWHDAIVHFGASSQGAGFYAIYLDAELVDARDAVSTIVPGSTFTQIEVGLFRDGERVKGTSEIRLDAARLGDTLESVGTVESFDTVDSVDTLEPTLP